MNNSTDEKAVETLCKAIVQTVKDSKTSEDIISSVVSVDGDYIEVFIMGNKYKIKNGVGVQFSAGDRALVHCVNGDFNNKIIIAKM